MEPKVNEYYLQVIKNITFQKLISSEVSNIKA